MKGFYRHIYFKKNKYYIIKNNELLLSFDNVYDALAHRDAFEEVDWDWDLYIEREIDEQKYVGVELPTFNHHDLLFIYDESKHGSKNKPFTIKKKINGKLKRFGRYRSVEDAIETRDLLIEHDWCSLAQLKMLKKE